MHHYLIDERTTKPQLKKHLDRIQSWIKTSRVAGEQYSLKSPQQIIEQIQKIISNSSSKPTIVVIGDDFSLDIAISALQEDQRDITLGFIPLPPNSTSAALLGFKDWRQACNALLKAKRSKFRLIAVEDYTILSECSLLPKATPDQPIPVMDLVIDKKLSLHLPSSLMTITNLSHESSQQIKPTPLMIESSVTSAAHIHLRDKKPLINVAGLRPAAALQPILKFKATTSSVQTSTPLLLQGIVQLRTKFTIKPLSVPQQLIADNKSGPLA